MHVVDRPWSTGRVLSMVTFIEIRLGMPPLMSVFAACAATFSPNVAPCVCLGTAVDVMASRYGPGLRPPNLNVPSPTIGAETADHR
jgi:hypothetical protein